MVSRRWPFRTGFIILKVLLRSPVEEGVIRVHHAAPPLHRRIRASAVLCLVLSQLRSQSETSALSFDMLHSMASIPRHEFGRLLIGCAEVPTVPAS